VIPANPVPVAKALRIAAILCCSLCACRAVPMAPTTPAASTASVAPTASSAPAAAAEPTVQAMPGAPIATTPSGAPGAPGRISKSAVPASVADLPLIVVPALAGRKSPWLAVFLSGDGGWVGIDRSISRELSKHGVPVVGWDSLKYFWSPRTPQGAAEDLDRVVRHYARKWRKSHVLLIGFSQGADTMPFMENRLPAQTRGMVGFTALLGISDNAAFEIHMANWLGNASGGRATAPELQNWSGSPYVCLYGAHDRDAACAQLTQKDGIAVKMAGGHHFGGHYARVAGEILSRLPAVPAGQRPDRAAHTLAGQRPDRAVHTGAEPAP